MSEHAVVACADPENDTRFLAYLLSTMNLGRLSGQAAQPGLSVKVLARQPLRLPPLETQRRIAAILGSIDDLIENNRRRIELLEQMAQAIYREWFVHFRYPGHENDELVDSPLGPIPSGWEWDTLDAVCSVRTDSADPRQLDPATPTVGLEHIGRQRFTLTNWDQANSVASRKLRFEKGDVLFGKIRPYFHKVALAPFDGICSSDAIVLRPTDGWSEFTLLTVFSDAFVAHAVATSNGTKMPRADWKVLRSWAIPTPPIDTLSAFGSRIRPLLDLSVSLQGQTTVLAHLRDLLLPKLVTGEIDVSTLDLGGALEKARA